MTGHKVNLQARDDDKYLRRRPDGTYIEPPAYDDSAQRRHDRIVRDNERDDVLRFLNRNSYRMVADNGWWPLIDALNKGEHRA